jgi:hypothetical protein
MAETPQMRPQGRIASSAQGKFSDEGWQTAVPCQGRRGGSRGCQLRRAKNSVRESVSTRGSPSPLTSRARLPISSGAVAPVVGASRWLTFLEARASRQTRTVCGRSAFVVRVPESRPEAQSVMPGARPLRQTAPQPIATVRAIRNACHPRSDLCLCIWAKSDITWAYHACAVQGIGIITYAAILARRPHPTLNSSRGLVGRLAAVS